MARVFFALWPDAAAREALGALAREAARRLDGRAVPAANLHVTLVFVGEVDDGRIAALREAAGLAAGSAFRLSLDRLGGFRRAGVAWAGCAQVPAALAALQALLEARVRQAGFGIEERAFHPHLTLARKVREAPPPGPMAPVEWQARAFALVESVRGAGAYRTLAEWPLEAEGENRRPRPTTPGLP